MTSSFSESDVEDAALDWLAELGWAVKHGPEIAPVGVVCGAEGRRRDEE